MDKMKEPRGNFNMHSNEPNLSEISATMVFAQWFPFCHRFVSHNEDTIPTFSMQNTCFEGLN